MDRRNAVAGAFILLCAIWGSTWLAIKLGVEEVPTFLSAALRFLVSAVALLVLAALFRRPLPRARSQWGIIAFVGLALFLGDYGLVYWGEANGVPSGLSAVLFAIMPLMTALAAQALLPLERLTARKLVGIGVGFGGIVVIFRGQLGAAGMGLLFPMLALVAGATLAGTSTAAMRRWARDIDGFVFNGLAMGIGALGLLTLSAVLGERWAVPSWPGGLAPILYLSLVGSVIAFVAYHWLLDHLEATKVSFILLITPIAALALGFSLANEAIDLLDGLGTVLTLGGLYIAFSRPSRGATARSTNREGIPVEPTDAEADGGR